MDKNTKKMKYHLIKYSLKNSGYVAFNQAEINYNFKKDIEEAIDEEYFYIFMDKLSDKYKISKNTYMKLYDRITFIKSFFLEYGQQDKDIQYIRSLYFTDIYRLLEMLVRVL